MTPTELEDHLLSYAQAAKVLGVSERTVWTLVNQGSLPAVRMAQRTVRIRHSRLLDWIERQESAQPPDSAVPAEAPNRPA